MRVRTSVSESLYGDFRPEKGLPGNQPLIFRCLAGQPRQAKRFPGSGAKCRLDGTSDSLSSYLRLEPVSQAACGTVEPEEEDVMHGDLEGLVAIIMVFSFPVALMALYIFYRVNKLRSEERMAALARGVSVPIEPELSQAARSRRSGLLLTAAAIGYMITFALIARVEPDAWVAASFGIIPLAVGVGFFLDAALVRRDVRTS